MGAGAGAVILKWWYSLGSFGQERVYLFMWACRRGVVKVSGLAEGGMKTYHLLHIT